jgi:hypothetical protein
MLLPNDAKIAIGSFCEMGAPLFSWFGGSFSPVVTGIHAYNDPGDPLANIAPLATAAGGPAMLSLIQQALADYP